MINIMKNTHKTYKTITTTTNRARENELLVLGG
jgi:hypothetical protein